MDLSEQEKRFYEACSKFKEGASDEDILKEIPSLTLDRLAILINSLSRRGLIQLYRSGTGESSQLTYKTLEMNIMQLPHSHSLEPDERVILQYISASGNKGIWIKELKLKSNIHQNVLFKVLKSLETSKKLIKTVKSVKFPTRKIYMMTDIEPCSELSGGPWFSENELDTEFITGLSQAAFKYITAKSLPKNSSEFSPLFSSSYAGYATLSTIHRFILESGLINVDLTPTDVANVLETLVYDGLVEKFIPSYVSERDGMNDDEDNDAFDWSYRIIKGKDSIASRAVCSIPCFVCPVFAQCSDSGPIRPSGCEYFKKWLEY